jgi:hypothetical protein
MAQVTINILGPLRLFLGESSRVLTLERVAEARQYIETHYGPVFQNRLKTLGVKKGPSLWDNSLFLLNGRSLGKDEDPLLNDGDRLDLGLTVAGG